MKILANENFPISSVNFLKAQGFDVKFVGGECPGVEDEEVMSIASSENRTIVTFDRDYGELIFKYGFKPAGGVIYLRLQKFEPEEPGKLLANVIEDDSLEFQQKLTVIDAYSIRQRKY